MSVKKVHDNQPKEFRFSKENLKKVDEILKKYPEKNKKSAVMPLLYLAQRQNDNWIPLAAMKFIAKYLAMPYICLLYTSPSPRDRSLSRMPSSA